jgi:hypothetical protein
MVSVVVDRLGSKLAMLLRPGVHGNTLYAGDKPGPSSRKTRPQIYRETKRKLLRPRHQIARINVRYGRSRPARRTGIAKSYYPAKTGELPSKPDRLWAVFLFGG